jgi:hypothetical protein
MNFENRLRRLENAPIDARDVSDAIDRFRKSGAWSGPPRVIRRARLIESAQTAIRQNVRRGAQMRRDQLALDRRHEPAPPVSAVEPKPEVAKTVAADSRPDGLVALLNEEGDRVLCRPDQADAWMKKGYATRETPEELPVPDLSSFGAAKLLAMVENANLELPAVVDIDGLRALLVAAWKEAGRPRDHFVKLAEARGPVE